MRTLQTTTNAKVFSHLTPAFRLIYQNVLQETNWGTAYQHDTHSSEKIPVGNFAVRNLNNFRLTWQLSRRKSKDILAFHISTKFPKVSGLINVKKSLPLVFNARWRARFMGDNIRVWQTQRATCWRSLSFLFILLRYHENLTKKYIVNFFCSLSMAWV